MISFMQNLTEFSPICNPMSIGFWPNHQQAFHIDVFVIVMSGMFPIK